MPSRIEDYALIGDLQTAALVARDGSIDWLCLPRFDSGACFAALLGKPEHGRWQIAPTGEVTRTTRRYRGESLILETDFETAEGAVRVVDFMPPRNSHLDVIRIVEGLRGAVPMRLEITIRFDYGSIIPWVRRVDDGITAVAGPNLLHLRSPVELRGEGFTHRAEFTVADGQRLPFALSWSPSHEERPDCTDPDGSLSKTEAFWREWSGRCAGIAGDDREAVVRSLITLKALTYAPSGGIAAAATTSLPEQLGGVRNWDYRYCWVRDATFTLMSLMAAGYQDEALAWRDWLLRAVAGEPSTLQIMYGLTGERRLPEWEIDWLPGYEGARPVRVGNAASQQFQLDVYGELLDALHQGRKIGLPASDDGWRVARTILDFVESHWHEPDEGIWEVRGPRRRFTHSQVMAWVALDRAVKSIELFQREGPADHWRALRDQIHAEVCTQGFDPTLGSFVQAYGSRLLDASVLMIPLVGFLPADDPRMRGTVAAIERYLLKDGFVARYQCAESVDGLPPGEGAFLACSFWLADNYALMGRHDDARRLFDRLLGLRNDVGLLSEEYDPTARRLVGNFPQAFSHVGLINTAYNLCRHGPAHERRES